MGPQKLHPCPSRQSGVQGAAEAQGAVIAEVVVEVETAATKVRAVSAKARLWRQQPSSRKYK